MIHIRAATAWLVFAWFGVLAHGQTLDHKGTEFILGFMPNFSDSVTLALVLTAEAATSVDIEYPLGTPLETRVINPGTAEVVVLPDEAALRWKADNVLQNLIGLSAMDEFAVTMLNDSAFSADAALGLPVDTMNTDYIVTDYDSFFGSISQRLFEAQFLVYAADDATEVTITPTVDLVGHSASTPFTVQLNHGEGYFAQGAIVGTSLTGSRITSNRPVGVSDGNACTRVKPGTTGCDHLFEVAQPVETWGVEIGVANLPQRPGGSVYRVVSAQDDTQVTLDGNSLVTLVNAGDFFETDIIPGNHVFRGDKPIFVSQYMTGRGSPGVLDRRGDPSKGNMIPFVQYLDTYTFSTLPVYSGSLGYEHYVIVIAEDGDTVELDGSALDASLFSPIPTTEYSAAVVEVAEGSHMTASAHPHGVTVVGVTRFISYLYPAGALLELINPGNVGKCCEASGGAGCCNVDCANTVCAMEGLSSCCENNGWTEVCAQEARRSCGNLCTFGGDNCCPTCRLSPCVDGATGSDLYHPHCRDAGKFIQCSFWGQCFEQDCPPGTVWNEAISTCAFG